MGDASPYETHKLCTSGTPSVWAVCFPSAADQAFDTRDGDFHNLLDKGSEQRSKTRLLVKDPGAKDIDKMQVTLIRKIRSTAKTCCKGLAFHS